jgi:hypothetical protein
MENDFHEVMRKRSDAELLEILTKYRNDYQADAIIAAETELAKRNLTLNQVELAKQKIQQKDKRNEEKANAPLDIHWKVLTCIFPGIINIIIGGTFKADGYHRKFKELIKWTLYGVGFYVGLLILLIILVSLLS